MIFLHEPSTNAISGDVENSKLVCPYCQVLYRGSFSDLHSLCAQSTAGSKVMGAPVFLFVAMFPYHKSPCIKTGLSFLPPVWKGRSSHGTTFSNSWGNNRSKSSLGPHAFFSCSTKPRRPRLDDSSHVSDQVTS